MLDIKLLRNDPNVLIQNLKDRGVVVFDDLQVESTGWAEETIVRLQALDEHYLERLRAEENLRHRQNENAAAMKAVARLPKEEQAEKRGALIEEGRGLRDQERDLKQAVEIALRDRDTAWGKVPNLTHPQAPRGRRDDEHRLVREVGTRRDFAAEGFEPAHHVALCEALKLADFAAGARVSGQKFYYLTNEAVWLDLALQRYALGVAERHGFVLHTTPDLARAEVLQGLGFNPRGASTQVYSVEDSDLCLVGTSEITLGGMVADARLDVEALPLLLAGLSHCFRTEAGAAGAESRGLYRVHQFTKVELFACTEGDLAVSEAMHARILAIEEEIFTGLELPYRVLDIASGDLGGPAYRKYDIEAWMPGRGGYGEVTSASNCTDYQARRLMVRYRPSETDGKKAKSRFVHMLNGTAIANTRTIVALLENHQQRDGSVRIPSALQPLCGFDQIPRPPRHVNVV